MIVREELQLQFGLVNDIEYRSIVRDALSSAVGDRAHLSGQKDAEALKCHGNNCVNDCLYIGSDI